MINKEVTKNRVFWKILLALLVCPLSLFVIRHRKFWTFFWILLLLPFLLILSESLLCGGGFKRVYYLQTYNKEEIRVVEGSDFLFYVQNHSENYKLNSKYYGPHRILLIPDSRSVPVQYEFEGEILIEIYDNESQQLHSFKANKPKKLLREDKDDYFGNYLIYRGRNTSYATSVFAFELGEIPFDLIRLRWSRMKNMTIKVTVTIPDKNLKDFCESATFVIIPDLRT